MKIRSLSLTLFNLALILSTTAFANCPNPQDIYYNYTLGKWKGGEWESDFSTVYFRPKAKPPVVDFLEVSVPTGNGKSMPGSASEYVRCIYRVANYGVVAMRLKTGFYHWTRINNQDNDDANDAWEYIPHEGDPNYGEWRCSKSVNSCSFGG